MRYRLALFLILFGCFGLISVSVTFYALSPKPSQSFIGLGVYSRTGLEGYVEPASNATVTAHQTFNWTLSITNRMGTAQFVMIVARIANSTPPMSSPTTTTPSASFPEIAAPEELVGDGQSSNIDFNWTLESMNQIGGITYLKLAVNGQPAVGTMPVGAVLGQGFRWIFELWTYDPSCGSLTSSGCFHYGYGPQSSLTGVWLQIWFNAST